MKKHTFSLSSMGFLRVAVVAPALRVADVAYNTHMIIEALEQAAARGCRFALFPELCITGYSCADLFYQSLLREQAYSALPMIMIAQAAGQQQVAAVVGLPLEAGDKLSNCAAFIGDHMVLGIVPKTLVRYLIEWCAESLFTGETAEVLRDIGATPITPELLPLGDNNTLQQETEVSLGPYLLHDFFLFYTVRYAFSPHKVFWLSRQVFGAKYSPEEILHWLRVFYQRFFAYQFKRSAMQDGPKVGSVALSSRGDWRMHCDASNVLWMQELEALSYN